MSFRVAAVSGTVWLGLVGVAGAQGAPATVPASDAATSTENVIIVTARFREESSLDIGGSIVALSGGQLEALGVNDVSGLAALTPSLDIQDRGPNRNEISIRGIGRGLFQQDLSLSAANIGLYFDDVPLNLPIGAQLDVPTFDLKRVEVLRGPQGTLFGEGAQGGAIRYVSADPDLQFYGTVAEAYVNTTEDGESAGGGRISVNLPLVTDVLGVRLVANRTALGGYIDNLADRREDTNDYESDYLRGTVLYQPNDRLRVRFVGVHQNASQDALGYVSDVDDASFAGFSTAGDYVDDEYDLLSTNIRYDFGPIAVESITSKFDRERSRRIHEPVSTAALGFQASFLLGLPARGATNIDVTDYKQFSQELRFVSEFDGPFNFVAGLFYRDFELRIRGLDSISQNYVDVAPIFGLPSSVTPSNSGIGLAQQLGLNLLFPNAPAVSVTSNDGEQLSGFLEGTFDATDNLRVILGVRAHREDIEAAATGSFADLLGGIPPTPFKDDTTADAVLPKAALEYKLGSDALLYASYTEGLRNGNLNASSSVGAVASVSTPAIAEQIQVFEPEYVQAFEIGAKGQFFDRALTLTGALFRNNIDDVQGFGVVVVGGGLQAGVTENIGDGYSQGFEAEANWRVNDSLSVFAGGSYTEAELDSLKTGLVSGISTVVGQRLPFIPEYSFSLGAQGQRPIADGWEVFGGANYQYTGEYTTFFQAAEGSPFNPIIGGFGLANANLGLRNGRFSVDLRVANIFDEREIISLSPIQALYQSFGLQLPAGANVDDLQMTRPRTATLTLRATF